jgi:acyl-CoA oxidase
LLFNTEKTTLASAAQRIKKLIDSGLDPYDAFNIVQHQMIDVASLSRTCSIRAVSRDHRTLKTKNSKEVMLKLYQLYALSQIEKNKGWYLEDGYMEKKNKSHTQDG